MHSVLRALNQLETDQVIGAYAIGGAVGAAFWPLQILTNANPLISEAISEAVQVD
jgi:hypothetical protein